jgi:methylated-DNA-[protein]-cysteine S-methyltransferase
MQKMMCKRMDGGKPMTERWLEQLRNAVSVPSNESVARSRRQVRGWFVQAAPLIQWDVIESPVGALYIAVSAKGVCSVDFGVPQPAFLSQLDPLARVERNGAALAFVTEQLREYFAGTRFRFDLPLDLSRLTPFQQRVLQVTRGIAAGTVWTYRQVAEAMGKPKASRPVGQALGHNPVPIVVPCHRVVASDGSLGGYSAGGGLASKRLLLQLEGAL